MRSIARVCVAGWGTKFQGAELGVSFAEVGGDFLKDDGVELVDGGHRGDDDADVLFEARPAPHGHAVP